VSEALVEAIGLVRHYRLPGKRFLRTVDGVDLAIGRGGALGLVGESGSGKSTLGRTLVGLQDPSAGEVRFEGETVTGASGENLSACGASGRSCFRIPPAR
jgi:oligopeptide transport system ATP-binding protein